MQVASLFQTVTSGKLQEQINFWNVRTASPGLLHNGICLLYKPVKKPALQKRSGELKTIVDTGIFKAVS